MLSLADKNYIFQSYEYLSSWWRYFGQGRPNRELLLLVVEENSQARAIAPMMIKLFPFIKSGIVQFIGTDICDYMDFIIAPESYSKYLEKIIEYLLRMRFLEIDLKFIPEDSKTPSIFLSFEQQLTLVGGINQIDVCPFLPLQKDLGQTLQGLKDKLKAEITRKKRALCKKGSLIFKTYKSGRPLKEILDNYFSLHIKRWKDYGRKYSQFQYRHWRDFVVKLSYAILDQDWLDISYLEFNNNIVACHFGFRYNDRLYYYMPTFDPDLAAYSPAKILILEMIEAAHRENLKEFDFLRGQEPYKLAWTKRLRKIYSLCYYHPALGLRAFGLTQRRLYGIYNKGLKPVLKRLRPLRKIWYSSKGEAI